MKTNPNFIHQSTGRPSFLYRLFSTVVGNPSEHSTHAARSWVAGWPLQTKELLECEAARSARHRVVKELKPAKKQNKTQA